MHGGEIIWPMSCVHAYTVKRVQKFHVIQICESGSVITDKPI